MASGKRRNAVYIVILSMILVGLLAVAFILSGSQTSKLPLALKISNNDVTETIRPWCDDNGTWYFFMPSYASGNNTVLVSDESGCYLQNELLSGERPIDAFEIGKEYAFEQHGTFSNRDAAIVFLKSANVATMYIDTLSGSMKKVHADKNNKEKINMTLYGESGEQLYSGNEYADEISGRGNATWEYEKKPYNLSLNAPAKLIDKNENKNYILLANAMDKTNMRNKIMYDMAREAFPGWNASTKHTDLYINGEYRGLYLLTDKVEAAENKLNLSDDCFLYNLELTARAKEGSVKDVMPGISAELQNEKAYTKSETEAANNSIVEIFDRIINDRIDDKELTSFIDVDSWASLYICQEFSSNYDSGLCSLFFYLKGGKLYAGPLWDYDNTFGQRKEFQANGFCAQVSNRTPLWSSLMKYDSFNGRVKKMYKDIYLPLINKIRDEKYPELSERIEIANELDHMRWHNLTVSCFADDYLYNFLEFIDIKRDFLNSVWVAEEKYNNVFVEINGNTIYFTVKNNDTGEAIDRSLLRNFSEEKIVKYIDSKTDNEFDFSNPITEDTVLYALCSNSDSPDESLSELNWKGRLTEFLTVHKAMILLFVFCAMFGFSGLLLLCVDIRRSRKRGDR